ncbi:hypothetical protein [Fusobacterium ulcerans]|uniref:hypothetical protein n=1 Tax=Fusobacterium ulcerans TaxID=861 RepID=UPI00241D06D5|nr:hypothetical protein [Fusobacterium ulcerans]
MELTKTLKTFERDILKISGPLGLNMPVASGAGVINEGDILTYDTTTGTVEKYTSGDEAFSVALSVCDATTEAGSVTVAMPISEINIGKVNGITVTDYPQILELMKMGIILRGVDE